jgi:hypothetical protein
VWREDVVEPSELIVGDTYFMVTYPDATMETPVILTYRFLGKDPDGIQDEEPGPHYYFRYLPAFRYDDDEAERRQIDSGWEVAFPGAFGGWGESVPTSFSEEKVQSLNTLDSLIQELIAIRARGPHAGPV